MGDMGDTFRAMRECAQQRRDCNTASSTRILQENGIPYATFNNGVMLRIGIYDFFPSTGLFINRATKKKARGVFNLIKKIREASSEHR